MPFGLMLGPLAVIAAGAGLGAAIRAYATRNGVDLRKYDRTWKVAYIVLALLAGLLLVLLVGALIVMIFSGITFS